MNRAGDHRSSARIGAVVLAAGESRRMEGLDKRRLTIDGEALVVRWPRLLAAAGIQSVVVVLGHEADRIEALLSGTNVRVVRNPEWALGQQGSVRAGLAALPAECEATMIVLCDLALIDAEDLTWLAERFEERPAGTEVLVPVRDGVRGNPVVVSRAVVGQVLADPTAKGLRAFIDAHPERVLRIAAPNDHFTTDLDTQADIAALERRLGRRIGRG